MQALRELHAEWQIEMPGLRSELLRRADQSAGLTLLETHLCEHGLSPEWQERIERDASARLETFLVGERHIEVFEPCA